MDFIPTFRFVTAIIMFGILMYVFQPIITYLNATFPTSGIYAVAIFWIWGALAAINLIVSGIRFIMEMQRRSSY